jgi:hypothetical protein
MVVAIGYQEAVYGCVKTSEVLELGLPEELWLQVDKCITAIKSAEDRVSRFGISSSLSGKVRHTYR